MPVSAQDAVFSHTEFINSYDDPWSFGANKFADFTYVGRKQWSGLKGQGFNSHFVNCTKRVSQVFSFGLSYLNNVEAIGKLQTDNFRLATIIQMPLPKKYSSGRNFQSITFGFYAGYINKSILSERLVFSDQIDPNFGIINTSSTSINPNDIGPNNIFYTGLGGTYLGHLGNGKLSISPSFVYGPILSSQEANLYKERENIMPAKASIHVSYSGQNFPSFGSKGLSPQSQFLYLLSYRRTMQDVLSDNQFQRNYNNAQILLGCFLKDPQEIFYGGLTTSFVSLRNESLNGIGVVFGYEKGNAKRLGNWNQKTYSIFVGCQIPYQGIDRGPGNIWEVGFNLSFGKTFSNVFNAYNNEECPANKSVKVSKPFRG